MNGKYVCSCTCFQGGLVHGCDKDLRKLIYANKSSRVITFVDANEAYIGIKGNACRMKNKQINYTIQS